MYHQKRPRTDRSNGEVDWTCPDCGNVNFGFRTNCNMRKCGAPKPDVNVTPGLAMFTTAPSLGNPGPTFGTSGPTFGTLGPAFNPLYPASINSGPTPGTAFGSPGTLLSSSPHLFPSTGAAPPAPPAATSAAAVPGSHSFGAMNGAMPSMGYHGQGMTPFMPGSSPQGMQPPAAGSLLYDLHAPGALPHFSYMGGPGLYPSLATQISVEQYLQRTAALQNFLAYGHTSLGHPPQAPSPAPSSSSFNDAKKRRGGPDPGNHEGGADWVCPQCGNTNFGFRTHCNMRKCGEAKPQGMSPGVGPGGVPGGYGVGGGQGHGGGKRQQGVQDQNAPEGSWSCGVCGNLNYPSRTHCNRRRCGAKRGVTKPGHGHNTGAMNGEGISQPTP